MAMLAAITGLSAPAVARAQGANNGTITCSLVPITPILVTAAVAGSNPSPVVRTTNCNVRAGKANKPQKVSVQLSAALPAGLTLTVDMTPTTGATDLGTVTLDATARDLMGNITNTTAETETVTYTFAATAAAGVIALQSRTVTFTITSWP